MRKKIVIPDAANGGNDPGSMDSGSLFALRTSGMT